MTTSDLGADVGEPGGAGGSDAAAAHALTPEIARLANDLFFGGGVVSSAPPGQTFGLPGPGAGAPATTAAVPLVNGPPVAGPPTAGPAPIASPSIASPPAFLAPAAAPPNFGPSATALGAGGASPALTAPPLPGPVKHPPPATAPPPKASDLRAIPTLLADGLGLSSPLAFGAPDAGPAGAFGGPAYFLPAGDAFPAPSGAPGPWATGPGPAQGMAPAGGVPSASAAASPLPPLPGAAPSFPLPGAPAAPPGAFPGAPAAAPPLAGAGAPSLPGASPSLVSGGGSAPPSGFDARGVGPGPLGGAFGGPAYFLPPDDALAGPGAPTPRPGHPVVPAGGAAAPSASPTRPDASAVPPVPPPPGAPATLVDAAALAPLTGRTFQPEIVPDVAPVTRIFDGATIQRDFPILRERVHGRRIVWLDNAATTQKPQVVIDRLTHYYEHENSNVHRAAHTLAARATDAYEGARDTTRRFLNAPSAQDIVFVRGATEGINLVAKSWGRRNIGRGDEIVITWLEHHANIVPWQQLCAETGACLRVAPVDARGQVILEEYEKLLGPRTRLVSASQVSNALGTIVPVREMTEMAHRYGALMVVDGAQAVSHLRVDVQALDCDFYVFSGHKIFAPMGIGVVYGKRDVLAAMPPWQGGGNMIADVTFEKTTYQAPPWRFEAGTGSIADAVGLGAALDYVMRLGQENIARYEHELLEYATEGLERVPGLHLVGTAPDKAGVLSFVLDGQRTEDVGGALDKKGIAVRAGHHCAQPILRRFGYETTVRASLAPYNTREDVDALVAALLELQAGRPERGLPRSPGA